MLARQVISLNDVGKRQSCLIWKFSSSLLSTNSDPKKSTLSTKRLLLWNLPYSLNDKRLEEFMKQAGEIVDAKVLTYEDSGKSRGLGIVEYATINEAQTAIDSLSGSKILDRPIYMRESMFGTPMIELQRKGDRKTKHDVSIYKPRVFISNLAASTSWEELKDLLKTVGNIHRVSILMDGRAEAVCDSFQDARNIVTLLNNVEFKGQVIVLRREYAKRKSNQRLDDIISGKSES